MTFEQNGKEILKSPYVLATFLLMRCNTIIEGNLEEEGFTWLAIPGDSPIKQRSQNGMSMGHLMVKDREK